MPPVLNVYTPAETVAEMMFHSMPENIKNIYSKI